MEPSSWTFTFHSCAFLAFPVSIPPIFLSECSDEGYAVVPELNCPIDTHIPPVRN